MKVPVEFYIDDFSAIEKAISDAINKAIARKAEVAPTKLERLKDIIVNAIEATPEFLSLSSYAHGDLAPEFGFINADTIVSKLLLALRDAIQINIQSGIDYITLDIILDKDTLLASDVAKYRSKQYDIEWLRWLLEEGSTTIISDYEIAYNLNDQQYRNSRSKAAVMVEGNGWGVPSEFAGTDGNNFITRAIDQSVINQIEETVRKIFN